jgi:heavy metal sensor kinase
MIDASRTPVRTRLTLWYVAMLGAILLVFFAATPVVMYWQLWEQLDRHAVADLETVEGLLSLMPDGRVTLEEDYHTHAESRLVQERFLQVQASDGAILYRNDRLGSRTLGGALFEGEGVGGYSNRADRLSDGTHVLLVSRQHPLAGTPVVIRVGYSTEPLWTNVQGWIGAGLIAIPFVLGLAAFAGHRLSRRALQPIDVIAGRADRITAEQLHDRLPVGRANDEIAHLARVFNRLLARLEDSFERLRRFTSDASHELRTPLAAMRSVGEVGLEKSSTIEEYRNTIGSMLEEVNRLTALVDALLTAARGDTDRQPLDRSAIPVAELIREATSLLEVLVEDKDQQLIVSMEDAGSVEGDRMLLRQALVNLVHNSIKYSPRSSTIHVRATSDVAGHVVVEVADNGPGISKEHIGKVFDRFYRVEQARSRDAGGAGLGLSIAKWAVEAHGGKILVESTPGRGTTFQIQLPAA